MRHLHVLCEGQTEEIVAENVIKPHFQSLSVYVTISVVFTKKSAGGPAFRGGLSRWSKLEPQLRLLLGDQLTTVLTTLLDYYAFPADAPGMAGRPRGSPYDRVRHVESALSQAIGSARFLPHLVLHEIEAWVLAACAELGYLMDDPRPAAKLAQAVKEQGGPELVNGGPDTAPSKRILQAYEEYDKKAHGPLIIEDAGMDAIRRCCPHADDWLRQIETRLQAD